MKRKKIRLPSSFPATLRYWRKKKRYTLQELADVLGVSRQAINIMEKKRKNITVEKLYVLANKLEISISDLLPEKKEYM